jgi:polyphosphate kinase
MRKNLQMFNREISWLAFNHRVLQEARDESVPLHEKIKFMAIFSSNLDEFFRVRVAALRNLLALKEKTKKKLDFDPGKLLEQIFEYVNKQQEELGDIYRNIILKGLKENNIFLITDSEIEESHRNYLQQYFEHEIQPFLQPVFLLKDKVTYFLHNHALYLAVKLIAKTTAESKTTRAKYALVEIPTRFLPRFITLPSKADEHYIMFLDDAIRAFLPSIFPGYHVDSAYAIKITRDAEIYIDDEFSGDLVDKIQKGISRRKTGVPSRFLYDLNMSKSFLKFLSDALHLSKEDLIPGGHYHNFSDFFSFPTPGPESLQYQKLNPIPCRSFSVKSGMFDSIENKDVFLHYPYHSYEPVIKFLEFAARDKDVSTINITLYRVSADSKIISNLKLAAQNGKKVTVFVEIKARFDEESNIKWAEELKRSGVKVLYSFPGLKVHAKICLVRKANKDYVYLATGNFNEKTARIYTDFGLFTSRKNITLEIRRVFSHLQSKAAQSHFKALLVAPFNMRETFYALIDKEIENALAGKPASITIKLNNLEDKKIIQRLYRASQSGVKIDMIIRGISCLVPGIKNLSENINIYSIVDRFLEHTRIFVFHNGGREKVYIGSADWMKRNLSRRIEVVFPILDPDIKQNILTILNFQLQDNTKTRLITPGLGNEYRKTESDDLINAQTETYRFIQEIERN